MTPIFDGESQPRSLEGRRGLFVLFEGIPATVFESQVLMHVLRMQSLGLHMDIVAFAPRAWIYSESKARLLALDTRGLKISLRRCFRTSIPGARVANAVMLGLVLQNSKVRYDFLHCRTEYSAAVGGMLRMVGGPPVLWDARGNTIAEAAVHLSSEGYINNAMRNWRLAWINSNLRRASNTSDGALFVSDALRRCQGGCLSDQHVEIIPCVADENIFYFDPLLRSFTRVQLGFNDEDVVLVFSGSLAPWQCFSEIVALFRKLFEQAPNQVKLLILTPELDAAHEQCKSIPDFAKHITSVPLDAVNAYLNAADFGVLLRQPTAINHVASPVKFAEYALAGLTVLSTEAVAQVCEFGRELGNVIKGEPMFVNLHKKSNERRAELADKSKILLGRKAMDLRYMRLYKAVMKAGGIG
jgi:hypothetical protein